MTVWFGLENDANHDHKKSFMILLQIPDPVEHLMISRAATVRRMMLPDAHVPSFIIDESHFRKSTSIQFLATPSCMVSDTGKSQIVKIQGGVARNWIDWRFEVRASSEWLRVHSESI